MHFCVLGSGSKGNCTFVQGEQRALLIDAGFSGVEIERRLAAIGKSPADVAGILVTHEHSDHICGVGILSRKYRIPVFVNPKTLRAGGKNLERLAAVQQFLPGESFALEDFSIHPFSISHDTADPVGFIITSKGVSLGYCTDTGKVSKLIRFRLAGCHGLILECNHDPDTLQNGPYPPFLKQRVKSNTGHLHNSASLDLLKELLHDGLQVVVLAHISDTNNHPEIIENLLNSYFGDYRQPHFPRIILAEQGRASAVMVLQNS